MESFAPLSLPLLRSWGHQKSSFPKTSNNNGSTHTIIFKKGVQSRAFTLNRSESALCAALFPPGDAAGERRVRHEITRTAAQLASVCGNKSKQNPNRTEQNIEMKKNSFVFHPHRGEKRRRRERELKSVFVFVGARDVRTRKVRCRGRERERERWVGEGGENPMKRKWKPENLSFSLALSLSLDLQVFGSLQEKCPAHREGPSMLVKNFLFASKRVKKKNRSTRKRTQKRKQSRISLSGENTHNPKLDSGCVKRKKMRRSHPLQASSYPPPLRLFQTEP